MSVKFQWSPACSRERERYPAFLRGGVTIKPMRPMASSRHRRFSTNTMPRWPLAQPFRDHLSGVKNEPFWTRSRFKVWSYKLNYSRWKNMLVSSRLLFVLWFQDNIKMVLDCEAEKKPYIHILDRWELRIFGPQWGDQHHPGETNVGSKSSGNVSETTTLWSFTVLSICQRTCDDDDVISGWLARFRPNYMYIYLYTHT